MDLKEKVKALPVLSGVYLMKDSAGSIIYVGKAKNLKRRVQSYFQSPKSHSPKIEKLVKNIRDLKYIATDTEFEAFMLECRLIRKLKPLYNKMMKNPMSYAYIMIETNRPYPVIQISDYIDDKAGSLYFGPYTSRNTVQKALQGICECFKIPCSSPSEKSTSCLNYSIGLCIGMCMGGQPLSQYRNIVDRIISLFRNTDTGLLDEMKEMMLTASEKCEFETAAKYRDCINAVSSLVNKGKVKEFTEENKNIFIIERLGNSTVKIFLIKGHKLLIGKKYSFNDIGTEKLITEIKSLMLICFKNDSINLSLEVTKDEIDEAQIIYSYLKKSSCNYLIIPEDWLDPRSKSLDEALIEALGCKKQ